jgi:hypothetical protein
MKQVIQNVVTHAFRKKGEMLRRDREPRRTQKSNFDPTHVRTILISKAQQALQKVILARDRMSTTFLSI